MCWPPMSSGSAHNTPREDGDALDALDVPRLGESSMTGPALRPLAWMRLPHSAVMSSSSSQASPSSPPSSTGLVATMRVSRCGPGRCLFRIYIDPGGSSKAPLCKVTCAGKVRSISNFRPNISAQRSDSSEKLSCPSDGMVGSGRPLPIRPNSAGLVGVLENWHPRQQLGRTTSRQHQSCKS